ncbi:HSF-type DNA-binding-domain-containing protein [Gamsiella multidivaricata]|uniref:HSF-type DNA-binding-domain-containing protein n=1 Tax=Gamsiella multidivaricata TaxID=101098 RepID=UPI00221F41D4|nr:HSF-type DNA-binding-domain-containing protein [Gamsiella multidivaricata]KAI7821687.1 HSF-type DNA-binding-domain-containing protein [Gamsiella multidivaricata]
MVKEPASNNLIKWSDDGQSFIVVNHVEFAKEVLPKFFKHNNFSSFVRQLNMYGFHKVPHLQQGVLMPDADSEQWEFSNPHFQRNQPDLLYLVSRKKASGGNEDKDALTMDLGHILQEVTAIKRHQVAISTDLKNIERDHQSLWQESIAARERHQRQQDTIDKILRFLASVFSGDKKRAIVPNKKARLTITDGDHDGSSSVDDGRRLVEEGDEEEEENNKAETLLGEKRKRGGTDDKPNTVDGILNSSKLPFNISELTPATLALLANTQQGGNSKQNSTSKATTISSTLPAVPTVSAATAMNLNFPDYLTSLPALNYVGAGNNGINTTLPNGFKFDPTNITIPTTLLPNALSPVHHDMLRSISMANALDTTHNPPPLAPLPPSFSQTPEGASVTKSVEQITQEMDQLQRNIEALWQQGLIDSDAYFAMADSYDPSGSSTLGNAYQGAVGNDQASATVTPTSLSAVPPSLTAPTQSPSVGANPRISTVDEEEYLEDLLDMDPV